MSEKVAYNKYILIGGKVIDYNFSILVKTIITRINDLLISSRFKTKEELEAKYNCNVSILHYNSLISSIPTEWKRKLKGDKGSCLTNADISHLTINIKQLTNKIVYESLTYKHSAPSAEMKWENWKFIYSLPSLVTKNIKLHSLQYQIVHRYFACHYNLNIWNIGDDPTCPYCSEMDTIEHYFYYCKESALVWESLRQLSN